MDTHIEIRLVLSNLWKTLQDEMIHKKTLTKKHQIFVWPLVKDIKISDIWYNIQNLVGKLLASIIITNPI